MRLGLTTTRLELLHPKTFAQKHKQTIYGHLEVRFNLMSMVTEQTQRKSGPL